MTKLISGRVKKIPSANVSASRYDFIKLSETEPDLGLPAGNGYVLTSNVNGLRTWILPVANINLNSINELSDVDTVSTAPVLGYGLIWNGSRWVPNVITVSSTEYANIANIVLGIVQQSIVANNAIFSQTANVANTAIFSQTANVANTVLSLSGLTTSNLIEGTNLYYTNARVYANVITLLDFKANVTDLTTANVTESASNNLYFTIPRANVAIDQRVTKAFVENLGLNVNAATFAQVSDAANTAVIAQTSNIANIVLSLSGLTTSNLLEGNNLYYSNARVYANVISLLNNKANVTDLTTANVAESASNLYYTDARVYANVIGLLNAKANVVDLTTSNVIESASNLYYTNVRVLAGLANASVIVNDLEIKGNLQVLGNEVKMSSITVEDKVIRLANGAATANIADGAGIAILGAGANITYRNTGDKLEINKSLDVLGTLAATTIAGTVWNGLYTANVIETAGNLYYTDTRARAAISAGTGVNYSNTTGVISIGQEVNTTSNVTFNTMTVTGNLNVLGNLVGFYSNTLIVNDPLIQLGYNNPSDSLDLGFIGHYNDGSERHSGLFRDASDKKFKFFDNYIIEPGAGTIDTANASFRLANVVATTFEGNVVGNVTGFVSSINNFTTSNLVEGVNLYYSNARVYANVIGLLNDKANIVDLTTANVLETASGLYYTNARVYSNVIGLINVKANVVDLTTANVLETASGLYYTNARVYANVIGLINVKANVVDLTTANIIESGNTTTGNVFFSNARARNAISAGDSTIIYDATTGTIRATANITASLFTTVNNLSTSNVSEGSNLYYTNARVYSNVIALLPTLAGQNITIAANGQISATTSANVVITTGAITGLDTSNVAEAASNLYYTNARVYANIAPLLTTGNVTEVASNLYFTNARVYSNVVTLLSTYTGNINAGNITTTVLYANSIVGSAVGGYITGANLISANNISSLNWIGLYSANVIESSTNLFYTNSRVRSNVIALLPTLAGTGIAIDVNGVISASLGGVVTANTIVGLTTANVNEFGSNLYYTNARVYANVIGLLDLKANVVDLTTANVIESTSNLYYTNARVYSNVASMLSTFTGNVNAGNITTTILIANSIIGTAVGGYITGANLISTNNISSLNWIGLYTSNVIESASNLYYTNARVVSNVIALLPTLAGTGITIDANGIISSLGGAVSANNIVGLNTANVNEFGNLYYTNARVYANVISLLPTYTGNISAGNISTSILIANSIIGTALGGSITGANLISTNNISSLNWIGIYTANVIESASNLYYTNTRVRSNVIALLPSLAGSGISIDANGVISASLGGVVFANTVIGLTTANVAESESNLYYTNARVYANVISLLDAKANVVDLTTANVIESVSNLYYTNARVYSNVASMLASYTGNINAGNITTSIIIANSIVGTALGGSITGANLISTNNISSLNGTFTGNISAGNLNSVSSITNFGSYNTLINLGKDTGIVNIISNGSGLAVFPGGAIELSGSSVIRGGSYGGSQVDFNDITRLQSLRFADVRIETGTDGTASNAWVFSGKTLSTPGNVIVSDSLVANGLVIRGINVNDSVLTGNITANTSTSDTVTANTITANIWNNLYTANVVETAGNLYFTNTRVVAALVAGDNITIEANGRISSSGSGGGSTQLTVSSSQTLVGGNKDYTLSSSVNNANSIIVSINGMVQAPAIDYTLNGGQGLQFSANTTANALIEVKYYGYSALSPNVAVVSSSVTIPTVAGQAAYMMGANVTQAQSIMVALDGLIQRPTVDYTVNNTTITMIPAPPEGSNIEIRFFGQEAVALAGAQYTTAYISNSRTYAGGSANLDLGSNVLLARNIIVNIDGVTQIPDLNYTVSGNTLSFGTSVPAVGSLVEVKFFGAEAFNANLTQAMVTAVLPTVLSNDTLVRQIIRSSAYAFSRIFY
jgi:exosome complex RNA-binding protein Rrp4